MTSSSADLFSKELPLIEQDAQVQGVGGLEQPCWPPASAPGVTESGTRSLWEH